MENQISKLNDQVVSEVDLLKILNIELPTLSALRLEKNFPVVRLNQRNRVYLVGDVMDWLKAHRELDSGT